MLSRRQKDTKMQKSSAKAWHPAKVAVIPKGPYVLPYVGA
jgi:hypothetical protein